MKTYYDIVVDFDGTVVYHKYPVVGSDVPMAVEVLKELVKEGHRLILFTMRSRRNNTLRDATDWFEEKGIELFGVQRHPDQGIWTDSPKAYGQIIIDDAALGAPLQVSDEGDAYVDWVKIREILVEKGLLK